MIEAKLKESSWRSGTAVCGRHQHQILIIASDCVKNEKICKNVGRGKKIIWWIFKRCERKLINQKGGREKTGIILCSMITGFRCKWGNYAVPVIRLVRGGWNINLLGCSRSKFTASIWIVFMDGSVSSEARDILANYEMFNCDQGMSESVAICFRPSNIN